VKRTSKRHRGDELRKESVLDYVNAARNRSTDKQPNIVELLAMKEGNEMEFEPPRLGGRRWLSR